MTRKPALIITIALAALPAVAFAQEPTTYAVPLPSGGTGHVIMSITAGEATVAAAVMVLAAINLFRVLQAIVQAAKAK